MHANFKVYDFKKRFWKTFKIVKNFQIKYYDKRHNFQFYTIKNWMLNFKNIIFNRFSKKLNFNFYKSYKITSFVKKMTYWLTLFKAFQSRNIHDVFHVLLFKSYINRFDIDSKSFVLEINNKNNEKSNRFLMIEFIKKNNFSSNDWTISSSKINKRKK